jgi:hypothetical protein
MNPSIVEVLATIGYDVTTGTDSPTGNRVPLNQWLRSTRGAINKGNHASKRKADRAKILGKSAKIEKSNKAGVLTAVGHLSPFTEAGINLCAMATRGCAESCLGHTTRRMAWNTSKIARIKRSLRYHLFRDEFMDDLRVELRDHIKKANGLGMRHAIRLNGSTDILWERTTSIIQEFPDTQFYDYTKYRKHQRPNLPANYHLTFSISDRPSSIHEAMTWLRAGHNAALVVRNERQVRWTVAMGWRGFPAIDGDETDIRFDDPAGHVVTLYAKGAAKYDKSGFVKDINTNAVVMAA